LEPEPRRSLLDRLRYLVRGRHSSSQELEAEIQGLVDQGEAQGILTQREGDMIEAVLELDDSTASQVMVPRTDMAMVPSTATVSQLVDIIVESGHSRIPVYHDNPDIIVGLIYAKDLLPYWGSQDGQLKLSDIMRPAFFVPPAMPLDQLLTDFRRKKAHLAIVVDEYGGTAGVVSIEDVLEEIVGEIEDEYDQEESLYHEEPDGSLLVDARLEVEDLADLMEVELPESLPEGNFETVGGFVTTLLGRVPRPSEEVCYGPVRILVREADERRITKVQVTREALLAESAGE
jgi:CBS domain containing-hemolysin-like protein